MCRFYFFQELTIIVINLHNIYELLNNNIVGSVQKHDLTVSFLKLNTRIFENLYKFIEYMVVISSVITISTFDTLSAHVLNRFYKVFIIGVQQWCSGSVFFTIDLNK